MNQEFNYFITLNFFLVETTKKPDWLKMWSEPGARLVYQPALNGMPVNYLSARTAMNDWRARIDSKLFGRTWSKAEKDQRLFFFAFPEHGRKSEKTDNNLHYHLMSNVPYDQDAFEKHAKKVWKKVIPSGQVDFEPIKGSIWDALKTRNYSIKDLLKEDAWKHFIISSEFQA